MKRSITFVALTGAVVLLAGCGSTSGTAAPASSSISSSISSSADTSTETSSTDTSSSETSSSETSSSETSSSDTSSSESSSSDTSSSQTTDESSTVTDTTRTAATKTIGDTNGSLDGQTSKWFDTFCTGFGAFGDLSNLQSHMSAATNPKDAQKQVVVLFDKIGGTFIDTSASLKDLPPPTFSGGPEFAAKIVPVLATFGSALRGAATKAAAVDVTKDPTGLATALGGLSGSMSSITSSLSDFKNLKMTPQTQAAIEAIPSCAKLKSLGG